MIRDYDRRMVLAVETAGVEKFTFQDLRRHVSDGLRRAGVGVKAYQQAMGHSISTAMREYQQVPQEEVLAAFARAKGRRS